MTNEQTAPWTVLRLLNWTKDHFAKGEVDAPRLSAEVLLAHALGCKRIELYTRFDYQPSAAQLDSFREMVRRAGAHEPIAYLVGFKEFYSLGFKVTADVLVPRAETELLVSEAIDHLRSLAGPATMWDVCTGSGCVAIATAVNVPQVSVLATDISQAALAIAGENAARHKVDPRVRTAQGDLLNLGDANRDLAPFDVITANPPYIGEGDPVSPVVKHEPAVALFAGKDGLKYIKPLIAAVGAFLKPGGKFVMEFGQGQADAVRDLIVATSEFNEPRILRDHQGIERAAVAVRKG